jgi:hypothetical protein
VVRGVIMPSLSDGGWTLMKGVSGVASGSWFSLKVSDDRGGVIGTPPMSSPGISGSTDIRDLIEGVGEPKGVAGRLQISPGVSGTRISNSEPFPGPDVCDRKQNRSPPSFRAIPFATINPSPRPSL